MPMMLVGSVRVAVRHGRVRVGVHVGLARRIVRTMGMLVMGVMQSTKRANHR